MPIRFRGILVALAFVACADADTIDPEEKATPSTGVAPDPERRADPAHPYDGEVYQPEPLREGYTRLEAAPMRGIAPAADVTFCQYVMPPVDRDMDILSVRGKQSVFGPHAVAFSYTGTGKEVMREPVPCGGTEFSAKSPEEDNGHTEGQGGFLGSTGVEVPEGVAFRLKKGDGIMLNIQSLMAHAPTLRAAFAVMSQFHRLLTDQMGYDVIEHEDSVILRSFPLTAEPARVQRFVAEMLVSSMFKVIREFDVPLEAPQVSFAYEPPSYHAEYARVFAGDVRFGAPWSGIVFGRAHMDAVSPHRDADVHDALRSVAERRMLRLSERVSWAERVRDVLVQPAAAGPIGMGDVANTLGLSVRSLRRRLSAERVSYKSVVNEAFAIRAQHLLRTTRRTLQEIAFDLGFAETSAFHRAFKRRTGVTPQQYRSGQLGG